MSWIAVARKDFRDAVRSRLLWGLALVFTLVVSVIAVLMGYFFGDEGLTSGGVLNVVHILFSFLVPLIALVIAHGAVVGERESGSMKLLLSLPHSREDVVFGKVLGRSGALTVPLFVGLAVPAIGMVVAGVSFDAAEFVAYALTTALVGVAFVSIAVGVSAVLGSRIQVVGALLGFYFVFVVLWRLLRTISIVAILVVAEEWPGWMPLGFQDTMHVFQLLSPTGDFYVLKASLFEQPLPFTQVVPDANTQLAALLMLFFWILLPMVVGMWRFNAVDL